MIVSSFESKLKLSLAYLNELGAPLDECLNRSKDRVRAKIPLPAFSFIDDLKKFIIDFSPSFTALDGILQIFNAFLYITIEHVIDVDVGFAPLDYLIWNFIQKSWNSLVRLIVFRMMPDHSDPLQELRNHLRNLLRLRILQLLARLV